MTSLVTLPVRLATQWTPPSSLSKSKPSSSSSDNGDDALEHQQLRVALAVSGVTDPGGVKCRMNQDAFFTHCDAESRAVVIGVFDGHGKEAGRDAALAARDFFEAHFRALTRADYDALERTPQSLFTALFHSCHAALRTVLTSVYERRGFAVSAHGAFLVKTPMGGGATTCMRGGTTATLVVVLDGGRVVLTANVGDSTVAIAAKASGSNNSCVTSALRVSDVCELPEADALEENTTTNNNNNKEPLETEAIDKRNCKSIAPGSTRVLLLTGDHSPDSEREFVHARTRCPATTDNPNAPALHFLYDVSDPLATRRPVFSVSASGAVTQQRHGDYLKNVRDEWATLVATPSGAAYAGSLAFTRSLGDFYMHAYGVRCDPSVRVLSLEAITRRTLQQQQRRQRLESRSSSNQTASDDDESDDASSDSIGMCSDSSINALEFMLVAASDGVWDAWKYDDLFAFIDARDAKRRKRASSNASSSNASSSTGGGDGDAVGATDAYPVDRTVASLLKENVKRAQSVFGDDADNMTAVLCHFRVVSTE